MNLKEEIEEGRKEIIDQGSMDNMNIDQKRYLKLFNLVDWFINNTLNEYLDGNSNLVLKSIRTDNPPIQIAELLIEKESKKLNRKRIISALSKILKPEVKIKDKKKKKEKEKKPQNKSPQPNALVGKSNKSLRRALK